MKAARGSLKNMDPRWLMAMSSAEVAEGLGSLFLGMAAAARARGEQTPFVDLDEVVLVAESD